jgi:hypothetical protein
MFFLQNIFLEEITKWLFVFLQKNALGHKQNDSFGALIEVLEGPPAAGPGKHPFSGPVN